MPEKIEKMELEKALDWNNNLMTNFFQSALNAAASQAKEEWNDMS